MARPAFSLVLDYLRRTARPPAGAEPTDGDLLEQFVTRKDPSAFDALMRRHGALVWGVCRRLLPGDHDAEDAFQATFLVLARKAGAVRWRGSAGPWLYATARRVARNARVRSARRSYHETRTPAPEP